MRLAMKILKYFLICFFALSMVRSQDTFTKEEALEMIKQRDAQWEDKLAKANTLIEFQKITIAKSDSVILKLEEQAKLDTLVMLAQKKQIDLLKSRDESNEKMIDLVEKKWYENQYLWLGIGFVLGKI